VVEAASQSSDNGKERLFAIAAALLEAYRGADAEHQVQIASLKLLPAAQQEKLKELERKLVTLVSDALLAALPGIANRRHLLKPLTMSVFAMLNWHYLWFREGKGISRDNYARMVTSLILAGADAAMAAADKDVTEFEPPSAKKKSLDKARPAFAGRTG